MCAAVGQSRDEVILLCGQESNLTAFSDDNTRDMTLRDVTFTEFKSTVGNRKRILVLDTL